MTAATTQAAVPRAAASAVPSSGQGIAARRRQGRRFTFGARTRKALLLTHIVAAGAWLGLDVAMGALVVTIVTSEDRNTQAVAAQALELVTVVPMLSLALLTLATGVLLALGSKYGLLRYWWVLVKLVLNIALATLIVLALRGGVQELAAQGRQLADGAIGVLPVGDMAFPPIVSTTALLAAMTLSVFKPWGRTRRRPRP